MLVSSFGLAALTAVVGSQEPALELGRTYWEGTSRTMATTPLGNVSAVSAHNCYVVASQPSTSLAQTLDLIHAAQANGADLIELDVKSEDGVIYVDHDDEGTNTGAHLSAVLSDPALLAGDQVLFVEIKEKTPDGAFIHQLLSLFAGTTYARPGRALVLRSFNDIRANLKLAQAALDTPAFLGLRPWVKLNELFGKNQAASIAAAQQLIRQASLDGFAGVEFHYQDRDLFGKLGFARSLGLGINVWTIPVSLGEVFVASLREEVDAITVDYPVDLARSVVQDSNLLTYMNTRRLKGTRKSVGWFNRAGQSRQAPVNQSGAPTFSVWDAGQDLYGGVLTFDAMGQESVALNDADNRPAQGYLVSAVVNFDDLSLSSGETVAILSKADSGGFALELHNPVGLEATVLRFGVYVGGGYVYGTVPASKLNTTDSFVLTGCYDGDGGVWLFVDHSSADLTKGSAKGGVVQNDSPVRIGADPQGAAATRFHFSGKVQQIQVQTWGSH